MEISDVHAVNWLVDYALVRVTDSSSQNGRPLEVEQSMSGTIAGILRVEKVGRRHLEKPSLVMAASLHRAAPLH